MKGKSKNVTFSFMMPFMVPIMFEHLLGILCAIVTVHYVNEETGWGGVCVCQCF